MKVPVDKPDRRRLRAERSTEAVIDAMLDLYRAGVLWPSAADIALRSGVSERTVYRLFDDLEALATATIERQTARVRHLFAPPDRSGSVDQRIGMLAAQRMTLYEEIAPVVRAGRLRLARSAAVRSGFEARRQLLRRQVERQFQPELDALPLPERVELLAALDLAAGIEALEFLRHIEGLSVEAAQAVVIRTLRALVANARPVEEGTSPRVAAGAGRTQQEHEGER